MNLITSGGFKPGEMVIYSAGRGAGKSIYNTNLCKEIMLSVKPEPKYKFSRKWHTLDFDLKDYHEVRKWCGKQFGPEPKNPDAWSRWYFHSAWGGRIHFRDERDAALFILRWS